MNETVKTEMLTLDDYLRACLAISNCTAKTLPYVLQLLREAGFAMLEDDDREQWEVNFSYKKTNEERKAARLQKLEDAFNAVSVHNSATLTELADEMGCGERSVRRHLKESACYSVRNGLAIRC